MAIETTTVDVVMPAMGDSVSEGTVLEWHKAEGDSVAADETLVEISTDKVDAEVPAPIDGTVVKVCVAEGETIHVGAVLAEISPTNGARSAPPAVEEETIDIAMPAMGESVSEGVVLEWSKQGGDAGKADVLAGASGAAAAPPAGGATLIKGASSMLARYMDESRQVPTATSFRTITVPTPDPRRKQAK